MTDIADRIIVGDCIATMEMLSGEMPSIPTPPFDAIITDPPYNVGMDTWDRYEDFVAFTCSWAVEAIRLLKPGGYLCAFADRRTYHQVATGIERAGFAVVDQLLWLHEQGRPKGLALDRAIDAELDVTAEREMVYQIQAKTFAVHAGQQTEDRTVDVTHPATEEAERWLGWYTQLAPAHEPICLAQRPFGGTDSLAENVLGRVEILPDSNIGRSRAWGVGALNISATGARREDGSVRYTTNVIADEGAIRFVDELYGSECARVFFCPKPPAVERHSGGVRNTHRTVKPVGVMDWLCKLVTPPGGLVLDPFSGSGTTLLAAHQGGFHYTGIEMNQEYADIAERRIKRSRMAAR